MLELGRVGVPTYCDRVVIFISGVQDSLTRPPDPNIKVELVFAKFN